MLFLAILVLALGWAGWLWAWGRDRVAANHGFAPIPLGGRSSGRWAMPRSAAMSRTRRRDVLVGLCIAAMVSFVFARSWSMLWVAHGLIDVLLLCYGIAVVSIEQRSMQSPRPAVGAVSPLLAAPRMSLQPIVEDGY